MTISVWWVLWALLGGGCAGMLVTAMMRLASEEDDRMEVLADNIRARSPNPPRFGV